MSTFQADAGMTGTTPWKDRKRYWWLLGLVVPLMVFNAPRWADRTGLDVFWFFGPILVFVLVPLFDLLVGTDDSNPPAEALDGLQEDHYYRWLTYLYIPLQYAGLVWATSLWASGELSGVASFGLALTVGVVSGIGINTAHELGHKHPGLERWLARIGLAPSLYGHFYIEHNRGHHRRVSTPEDPASSRMGENFYEFLPRSVVGGVRSAIHLERERADRLGRSFWSPRNDVLNAWAISLVVFGGLVVVFGASVLPWLLFQAVVGFCLLEVVNYIEHYGLLRTRMESGRYERTQPEHSWNANNTVTNLFLFHLQRHSDHHAHPTVRYQALRHFESSPQLPTGYAGMIVLAAIPPLWRRVMDPRVRAHYDDDLTRANLHPRRRDALLAREAGGAPA